MATALQVAAARIRFEARKRYLEFADAAVPLCSELLNTDLNAAQKSQIKQAQKEMARQAARVDVLVSRLQRKFPALLIPEWSTRVYGRGWTVTSREQNIGDLMRYMAPRRDGRPRQEHDGYGRGTTDALPDFHGWLAWLSDRRKEFPACRSKIDAIVKLVKLSQYQYELATMPENEIIALAGQTITVEDADDPAAIVSAVMTELAKAKR